MLRVGFLKAALPLPRDPFDLTGFGNREGPATGVHDHPAARVLVAGDGTAPPVAVVALDLLALDHAFVRRLKRRIEKETGIPPGRVMVACTHTHSGPASILLNGCGDVDEEWRSGPLIDGVARAVFNARGRMAECEMSLATARVRGVSYLRRRVKRGSKQTILGKSGADRIAEPQRLDDRLLVAAFRRPGGAALGGLVNFSAHPVVLAGNNRKVSADFPGYAARALERGLGARAVSVYLSGTCGDINSDPCGGDFERAREIGEALAGAALASIRSARPASTGPADRPAVAAASCTIDLPLMRPNRHEIAESLRGLSAPDPQPPPWKGGQIAWAKGTLRQIDAGKADRTVAAEVQAIRIGNLCLIGVPAETFQAIGGAIRRAGPRRFTAVVGYANGCIGYLPTREAYPNGGYEVQTAHRYYGHPAVVAPEAGERVVAAAIELLGEVAGAH